MPAFKMKMFVAPIVMIGLSKSGIKVDDYTEQVRMLFAVALCFVFLSCRFLSNMILQKAEEDKNVTVKTKVPGVSEEKVEVMTVMEYDLMEVGKIMKQAMTSAVIVGGLHWYKGYCQPLVLQAAMLPFTIFEHQATQVHVFGKPPTGDLKRPWKEASPFDGLADAKKQLDEAQGKTSKEEITAKRESGKSNKQRVRKDK